MPATPRDWHQQDRTGRIKAARVFSNIVSPPIMGAVLGLAAGLSSLPFWQGFAWAALYGLTVSLTPILFVLFMLRAGRIQELHMSDTRERHLPYLVGIGCSALVYLIVAWLNGPELIGCLALFNALQLAGLGIVNVVWLISFHASAMVATMLIAWRIWGIWTLAATIPLLISVIFVRLYLKRHTPGQIWAGLALGAGVVLSLILTGCFG